jgi:ribosomal-protein-alanine N-acetyltransferase
MSRSAEPSLPAGPVELLEVTDHVLDRLLAVALNDADADDVTPPLGGAGWNPERITWFFEYHRAAAAGLDGPARQKSWAISCGGQLAGSIRLRRTGRESVETGLWLGRSFRGRGIGRQALQLVMAEAAAAGADVLEAQTTIGNTPARALLRSMGAALEPGAPTGGGPATVAARIRLR